MSVNASELVVPGHGTVFEADVNTAFPADFDPLDVATGFTLAGATPPAGWRNLGHTSKQNVVSFTREGGDSTSLDTYLADAVRITQTSGVRWGLRVGALQVSLDNLDLAFNGSYDATNNRYVVPSTPGSNARALFVFLQDNTAAMGFYIPNTEIALGDVPSIDPSQFFEMPLAASFLTAGSAALPPVAGKPSLMAIYRTGLGA